MQCCLALSHGHLELWVLMHGRVSECRQLQLSVHVQQLLVRVRIDEEGAHVVACRQRRCRQLLLLLLLLLGQGLHARGRCHSDGHKGTRQHGSLMLIRAQHGRAHQPWGKPWGQRLWLGQVGHSRHSMASQLVWAGEVEDDGLLLHWVGGVAGQEGGVATRGRNPMYEVRWQLLFMLRGSHCR